MTTLGKVRTMRNESVIEPKARTEKLSNSLDSAHEICHALTYTHENRVRAAEAVREYETANKTTPLLHPQPISEPGVAQVPIGDHRVRTILPPAWTTVTYSWDAGGVVCLGVDAASGRDETIYTRRERASRPEGKAQRLARSRRLQPLDKEERFPSVRASITEPPGTLGFELTALCPGYTEHQPLAGLPDTWVTTPATDEAHQEIAAAVIAKLKRHYRKWRPGVGTDNHCIELASPVFKTTGEALRFYRRAWHELKKHKATPKHWQTVCGGNHLHYGLNNQKKIAHVLRHVARCYFLPWVFTQPDDTDSCDNVISSPALRRTETYGFAAPIGKDHFRSLYLFKDPLPFPVGGVWCLWGAKEYAATINRPGTGKILTLEYRCVEAPKNESEFLLQLNFFNRFTRWALKTESPIYRWQDQTPLRKISQKQAVADFKALLRKLQLPYAPYAKFVNRNLRTRWTMGRTRQ